MSKKKGLGQHIEKSLKVMDELKKILKEFAHTPLKKGLISNDTYDSDMEKLINSSKEEAFALLNKVDDMEHRIRNVKMKHNSRFANRVVARFLTSSSETWMREEEIEETPEEKLKVIHEKKMKQP